MKIASMQALDKHVGFALCAALTAVTWVLPSRRAVCVPSDVRRILLMKFWGLGSILLLSPAVADIRRRYPGARLVFLTLSRNRDIAESLGLFDEVRFLEVGNGWTRFALTLLRTLGGFWRERFDMVLDFEFFTRFSAIMAFLSFARVSVGYHSWETWRGDIHAIKVPFNRYWHIMDNFYNIAVAIGVPKRASLAIVPPRILAGDRAVIDTLVGSDPRPLVVVHANVSDLSVERRWPHERFADLATRILAAFPVRVVFIGASGERPSVRALLAQIARPGAVDLTGSLTVPQLAELIRRAVLFIANDSGPLHLAVAMGTPTISFFGPETPVIYGPRGSDHTVFFKHIDCSPCMNVHKRKSVRCHWREPRCMTAIEVEDVFAAVRESLSRRGLHA